jgi:hydrogenase small subunit
MKEYRVIWFQASACSGCTISVLNTLNPSVRNLIIDPVLPGKHLSLVFQLNLMAASGPMALNVAQAAAHDFKKEYILVIEGAIPFKENGLYCTSGETDGVRAPIMKTLEPFARNARIIIALGTCAAFGGIPAAEPNPTHARCVNHFLSGAGPKGIDTPFINLSGCPCQPDWFTSTAVDLMMGRDIPLDEYSRPLSIYKKLVHHGCPRYRYYQTDVFARRPGDEGCFKEMGCKGRVTYADCPTRKWNSGISWCIEAGTPCIGCAHPRFPDIEMLEVN